ncbi:MAG: peptidase, M28 family protein [Flavobacteriaceae bacterium]|nr:MAG: peptidase, M28 family protein [Flavobacteriaceae bacterium]
MYDNHIDVKGMICLESIGYYSDADHSQRFPLKEMESMYGTKGNFIAVVQNDKNEKFSSQIANLLLNQNLTETELLKSNASISGVDFSDHLNYWKFNYEAVMITNTAFYRNKNYHTDKDLLKTLDLKKLNLVILQLYNAIVKLNE